MRNLELPQGNIVVIIRLIACHVLKHLDERREVDSFLLAYSLRLQDNEIINWREEGVDLEELSFPDEALASLDDGLTVGIGLLEHLLVEVVVHLPLRLDDLRVGDAFRGTVEVDNLSPTPLPAAQADLTARFCHEIGLGDHTVGTLRNLTGDLNTIDTFVVWGLRQSDNL